MPPLDIDQNLLSKLEKVKVLGIDLDGVIYEGNQLISGAAATLDHLSEMGYLIEFLTNNSYKSSFETATKLKTLGIKLNEIHVINGIDASVDLLDELEIDHQAGIFIIGSPCLQKAIEEKGYRICYAPECKYLVVGFTPDFSYETVCEGLNAIRGGATFIACNEEASFPTENGGMKPGCGALVAAVAASGQHLPDYIAGKPSTTMLKKLIKKYQCAPEEILVVGDTIESDIVMANRFGSLSCFVSRGRHMNVDHIQCTFIIDTINDLLKFFNQEVKTK